MGVFRELFGENSPRYIGKALYRIWPITLIPQRCVQYKDRDPFYWRRLTMIWALIVNYILDLCGIWLLLLINSLKISLPFSFNYSWVTSSDTFLTDGVSSLHLSQVWGLLNQFSVPLFSSIWRISNTCKLWCFKGKKWLDSWYVQQYLLT